MAIKRCEKVTDIGDVDQANEEFDNWIGASLSFESGSQTKVEFVLWKNKADNHIYLLPDREGVGEINADFLENYKKLKGSKFDPRTNERKIWKKPKTFSKFCEKLKENKNKDEQQ